MPSNTQISDAMVRVALDAYNDALSNLDRASDEAMSIDDIRQIGIKAALSAALAGHVVVPLVPTVEMIEAGCYNNPTQWNEGTDMSFAADVANDVYRAMISAAPPAQREG